ncbi:PREDICTED: eukaryotic translation initiation factor 3 subunit J [Chlamydotis macqueenii]|uniref:eukaryotic translation initiation factor 3 subunit J n=1 Tax=Chlamydotis macqueenii TaxID=187382 RepID=UPI000529AE64|nr:PREDICTED: eukaryotic translation initiation factor 3 subunit J [Chlamydotis macqueenii]
MQAAAWRGTGRSLQERVRFRWNLNAGVPVTFQSCLLGSGESKGSSTRVPGSRGHCALSWQQGRLGVRPGVAVPPAVAGEVLFAGVGQPWGVGVFERMGLLVADNWDDEEEEEEVKETEVKQEPKVSEKKKIAEKIKEKEKLQKKKQEELKKRLEAPEEHKELTPEEQLADKLRLKKLQEESDLELAKETFGVNNTCGIDAMNPSSKDDFTEFGKLLKEKITQYEKSLHYASFLEALVRDVCISLEIDDLKKITNTLTVLCSEKQKQEKNKAKKKKKGVVPGGGLKATMKDDLADYGGYDGEYVQDFEDFM